MRRTANRGMALVGLSLLGAGCSSDLSRPEEPTVQSTAAEIPGARPALITNLVGDSRTEAWIEIAVLGDHRGVGAYQGRVWFNAEKLRLKEVSTPSSGFRVTNTERAAEGEIRFGAFSTTDLSSSTVVTLRFEKTAAISDQDIRVELDALGDGNGRPIGVREVRIERRIFRK